MPAIQRLQRDGVRIDYMVASNFINIFATPTNADTAVNFGATGAYVLHVTLLQEWLKK